MWGGLEIRGGLPVNVAAVGYDAPVAHMDVGAVIGTNAVDGLQLCTAAVAAGQLIVDPARKNGPLYARPLESSPRDGNDDAPSVGCLAYGISLS